MFNFRRPHRRGQSASTAPIPEQPPSWEGPVHPPSEHGRTQRLQQFNQPSLNLPSRFSPPPTLPPLLRVTSGPDDWDRSLDDKTNTQNGRNSEAGSVTADAFQPYKPPKVYADTQRPESVGQPTTRYNAVDSRPQTSAQQEHARKGFASQGSTVPESQGRPVVTSRRPTGVRLATPPSGSQPLSGFETAQPRVGKRLNLLNPMSLLARRRTSHSVSQISADSIKSNRNTAPFSEAFDPRIRGTKVHDFSAPRPRITVSATDVRPEESTDPVSGQYLKPTNAKTGEATSESPSSPWSGGTHTPVFTEDFDEEQYPAAGPHVRRTSDFSDLTLPNLPYAGGSQKPLPSTSQLIANDELQEKSHITTEPQDSILDVPPPTPPKTAERSISPSRRISIDPASRPPKSTSSPGKTRPRNISQASAKDAGLALPKHMKSTSSRFSFDMLGAAEQERLLEDRHRKKALAKQHEQNDEEDEEEEMYDEDYDSENMGDDDGLEEPIPGVNADYDDGNFDDFVGDPILGVNTDVPGSGRGMLNDHENIASSTFQNALLSLTTPHSMPDTPRAANGEVIGFAMTKNSPHPSMDHPEMLEAALDHREAKLLASQLDESTREFPINDTIVSPAAEQVQTPNANSTGDIQPAQGFDEDMYFDDGLIEDSIEDGHEFDESVFDNVDTDQYGRPLGTFSSVPALYSQQNITRDLSPSLKQIPEGCKIDAIAKEKRNTDVKEHHVAPQPSFVKNNARISAVGAPHDLTQDKLAAYQSALAEAAFSAAANGKFSRDSIPSRQITSDQVESHPGLLPDSSHTAHYEPFLPSYDLELKDDFDYDDALEDDDVIAAANAEALAYDTDGFYGQEFGFYSDPAAGVVEYVNGGYFGPRGDGVNRGQSNRVREPNLTPITERSEYSNRNSFLFGMNRPESLTSPGLSQMLNSPDFEGEMSLNALLKLRRGAWGGSQASLHSSNGNGSPAGPGEDASPIGQIPPWAHGGVVTPPHGGRRASNASSNLTGINSEGNSVPSSPALTIAGFAPLPARDASKSTTPSPDKEKTEKDSGFKRQRSTTSTESFSYLKEEDPGSPTGERWVLERRRTSELGEVELLGREVVSGTI
ncbi:hypothetical protein BJ878DRAFT_411334 [Calycina marina]|uniref:Uncharacterized protein n=1 Tax=Calycina marina TaxID=1763456 RepID=A0A9P8CJ51_9HELO|nr:hypothetical protein BJ878DRAFT_411334 [Calycina marina]